MDIRNDDSNNRDRSYSKDSVPYASETSSSSSSSSGQQSRGRADTGDSSLSSDTNASTLSTGLRRRSHRPRGCRGGRKNRKKKNKVPEEIVGPASSTRVTTTSMDNIPQSSSTQASNRSYSNVPHTTSMTQFPPIQQQQQQQQQHQRHGAHHYLHRESSMHQQQHMSSPPLSNNNCVALNPNSTYTDNHNTAHMIDSSRSIATNNHNSKNYSNSDTTATSIPGLFSTVEGILPPPPPTRTLVQGIVHEKAILENNPYALTKQPSQLPLLNMAQTVVRNLSSNENTHSHPSTLNVLQNRFDGIGMETNTCAAVGGQSLFAISPRSFLTGGQGRTFQT